MDGTQAEADALMEEAAFALMHGSSDQAEGCLMLNISMTTLHEAASALGLSYDAWARSHRPEVEPSMHSITCVLQAMHVQTRNPILTDYVCLRPCFVGVAAA